ncbi:MAG: sigma-70 family RNA polymerase sigma factor [Bacteroidales bacterium]|nr:sigma-70 family RNA polymerase sigma factor [Bacteroidales bacterium]
MKQKELNIDESRLIQLCIDGNRSAQLELYKRHYKGAYNTALRIVCHAQEAEDVMQEAFIVAFRKLDQFSGTSAFGAWIRQIVVNKAIDAVAHRVDFSKLEEEALQIADSETNDEKFIFYRVDEIRKQILSLPDEPRIILSLFLFEGYDHQEIGQILDINHNAARTRYSRAKQRLVKRLREIGTFSINGIN